MDFVNLMDEALWELFADPWVGYDPAVGTAVPTGGLGSITGGTSAF